MILGAGGLGVIGPRMAAPWEGPSHLFQLLGIPSWLMANTGLTWGGPGFSESPGQLRGWWH
jgi:hypothetical protein